MPLQLKNKKPGPGPAGQLPAPHGAWIGFPCLTATSASQSLRVGRGTGRSGSLMVVGLEETREAFWAQTLSGHM